MIDFLHRRILLPAYETGLKRRKTFAYWSRLERTQWLCREELEQLQFDALRQLIRHAFEHCAYYRDAWRALDLDLKQLRTLGDFARWPIITRETVRENRASMRSCVSGLKLISKATGGSSGVPLQFDLDTDSHDRRTAAWHRGYSWAGAAPGTRQFYLWGVDLRQRPPRARLKDALYNRLYRKHVYSSFDLSEASMPRLASELARIRPHAIVAYTKPLYEAARFFNERNIKPFAPNSIVVGAEKLHDFERAMIERVFQAPVFETYGSREFMLIGAECERHEGMHLTAEHLLVEVLDENGAAARRGEEGDVVITDLCNYGMPFIRYHNGDRAVAGFDTCSCGRGLPVLKKIVGRQLDILRTPDGRLIAGEFFPHLMKDYPGVRRFQVIQESTEFVRIRLVVDSSWDEQTQAHLTQVVARHLGSSVGTQFERVPQIELTAAGKLQVVVNRAPHRRAA
jgi:phenylacetate-CoA ligase